MDKETFDQGEDFDIDDLLREEEDSPIEEEVTEETPVKVEKKGRGRPKGTVKKKESPQKIPAEISETEKELSQMAWQPYAQPAYEGLQNKETGELIDEREMLRRILCYAQEAARNSR